MKAIVVSVDTVMDVQAIDMHMLALNDSDAVICTVNQSNIAHG